MLGRAIAGLAGLRAYAIGLLVWVLCAVALVAGGYRWGWTAKANAVAAAQLQSVQNAAAADREARIAQQVIDRGTATALATDQAQTRIEYREIRKEVPVVTTRIVYRDREPQAPDCPYSDDFVRLYNRALPKPIVPDSAAGTADAAGGPNSVDTRPDAGLSPITDHALLANHVDNAELWATQRNQCAQLIHWWRVTCKSRGATCVD